jgi:hypothetical protein
MKISCKTFDPSRMMPDHFRFAHAKLDGNYLELVRWREGSGLLDGVRAYSSNDNDLTDTLADCPWFKRLALPVGLPLVGELYLPGEPASEVRKIVRRAELKFSLFAVLGPQHAAKDLNFVKETAEQLGLESAPFVDVMPCETIEEIELRLPPCEGIVFKRSNLQGWTKWKPVRTIDCVVTGWEKGLGKFAGTLGAFEVSIGEQVIASVSGFTDEDRADFWSRRDEIIGTVIEVAYQCVGTGGRLRHPRFKRVRTDKLFSDCLPDQDPQLAKWFEWYRVGPP